MVTVDDYGAIRRARRDGMSIRQIARQFHHSRKTVRHALTHAEPHPEPLTRNRTAPRLGPFQAVVDQILVDDEDAPPKQRHTAAQVFRRFARSMVTTAGTPRCNATCKRTVQGMKKHSYLWDIFPASDSKPTSDTSTSTLPRVARRCRSWSRPGPTRTRPSFWRCRSAQPKRFSKG